MVEGIINTVESAAESVAETGTHIIKTIGSEALRNVQSGTIEERIEVVGLAVGAVAMGLAAKAIYNSIHIN